MPKGGLFEGELFLGSRQPYAELFLRQVEMAERGDAPWTDFVSTGPTQSGKTTTCCLIPMMYALFELKENVIFGIPTMKAASSKWQKDIKPIIAASPYRDLMPARGPGSQGGSEVSTVFFGNGTALRFMTTGGGREERSSETARWLIVTEADSFSEVDSVGGEGRKIDQLIARTHSFGHRRRVFAECTVTNDNAFVWDTYKKKSSESQVVSQCESCGEWIRPERTHFVGWQEAVSQIESGRLARWMCEKCGWLFGEDERQRMVGKSRLLHRGQTISTDGEVSGPIPETRTLGFRWNAFDNRLSWTTAFIAENEWSASKSKTPDVADIAQRQHVWTLPLESDCVDLYELDAETIQARCVFQWKKSYVPSDSEFVTMGIDIGKHDLHWTLMATRPNGCVHVVDYGTEPVPSKGMELGRALRFAIESLNRTVVMGWSVDGQSQRVLPEQIFVDSGWGDYADLVYEVCRDLGVRYRAIKGYGFGQGRAFGDTSYTAPNKTTNMVPLIGGGWHLVDLQEKSFQLVHIDSNFWKSRLHSSIAAKAGEPGSFTIFKDSGKDREAFNQHLLSEKPVLQQKLVDGKGWDTREVWVRVSRRNHWLDSTCYAMAAADFVRLVKAARAGSNQSSQSTEPESQFARPDGRAFFVGARA